MIHRNKTISKIASKAEGFTLLEIIVAVAIFAVISSIVFPALLQFLDMRERVVENNKNVAGLQKAFLFLANDLRYAANRLGKDEFGDLGKTTLSVGDDSLLDLTTLYPDLNLSGLNVPRRVRWVFDDAKLVRIQSPVMDPGADTRTIEQSLLDDVESVDVQVHQVVDGRSSVKKRWEEQTSLPDMIEIEITLKTGVKYHRLLTMLGGDAETIVDPSQGVEQGGIPANVPSSRPSLDGF